MSDVFGLEEAYGNESSLMSTKMSLVSKLCEPGVSLLDIGCGTGEFISRVESKFSKIVGIDTDDYLLKSARSRFSGNKKVSITKADATRLKILGKFDAVSALDVVEHVDDPLSLLKGIFDVIAPGGHLYMTTPNWPDKMFIKIHKNSPHKVAHSSFGWAALVKKAGFDVTLIRTVKFPAINSEFLNKYMHLFGMCVLIAARKHA